MLSEYWSHHKEWRDVIGDINYFLKHVKKILFPMETIAAVWTTTNIVLIIYRWCAGKNCWAWGQMLCFSKIEMLNRLPNFFAIYYMWFVINVKNIKHDIAKMVIKYMQSVSTSNFMKYGKEDLERRTENM